MKSTGINYRWLLGLALLVPLSLGCGGGGAADAPPAESNGEQAPGDEETASTAPQSGAAAEATGQQRSVELVDGEGTEPAQSVAIFLDSLRRGDETAANAVLTTKAREELAKTDYVVEPWGTPAGKYEIGRVGYPYEDKTVALVECIWTEPATDNAPETKMELVCEVHEESAGWRISALGLSMAGGEDALLIDFEDSEGLQATIDSALGQPTSPEGSGDSGKVAQQDPPASNASADQSRQYPELPGTSGSDTGSTQEDGRVRVAFPNSDRQPVNR